jgi:hypothetical protein
MRKNSLVQPHQRLLSCPICFHTGILHCLSQDLSHLRIELLILLFPSLSIWKHHFPQSIDPSKPIWGSLPRDSPFPFLSWLVPPCQYSSISRTFGPLSLPIRPCVMDAYPEDNPKQDSKSCIRVRFSPHRAPIAIKALVPVLFGAPDDFSRSSLITRFRSIKNNGQKRLFSYLFIIKLSIDISLWILPVKLRNNLYSIAVNFKYDQFLFPFSIYNISFQRRKYRNPWTYFIYILSVIAQNKTTTYPI